MSLYVTGLVSVVIPTYKRSDKLMRAINSVFNQTYQNIELILVNDNYPGDEYSKIIEEKVAFLSNNPRFRLINQNEHINGAHARNLGIKASSGEYVAFLDDDDWWKPDKIEEQIKAFKKLDDSYGVVSCKIERYSGESLIAKLPLFENGYVYKDVLMLKSDFATGTLLIKHKALDDSRLFDERLIRHQDLQLVVELTNRFKLFQVDEYLHCCDISDTQNRPNIPKIIKAKYDFFISIEPILKSLSRSEIRAIKIIHRAEIGYVRLKHKRFLSGLLDLLPLITSPKALKATFLKIKNKRISKI